MDRVTPPSLHAAPAQAILPIHTDDAVHARAVTMPCLTSVFCSCIRGSVLCAAHVSHLHVLVRLIARVSSWRCYPRTVSFLLSNSVAVLPAFANTTFFVPSMALYVFKVMTSCTRCLLLAELQSSSRPGHLCLLGLLEGCTVTVAVSARDVRPSWYRSLGCSCSFRQASACAGSLLLRLSQA